MDERGDRCQGERPAEPDRQVRELYEDGDGERDQRIAPEFVAEAGSDEFVADLGGVTALLGEGGTQGMLLVVVEVSRAYGEVMRRPPW